VTIILAVIALVKSAIIAAAIFYTLFIVDKRIEDVKTGLDEIVPGLGGVGIFVIVILLLVVGVVFLGRGLFKR